MLHMVGWGFYLTDPLKRILWIGMTVFWIALLLYVRIVKPLYMLRRPYRVVEVRRERGDTTTLVMQPEGHAGFRFKPGQFGWLTLWASPFRITGHPFSFSSSAEAPDGRVEMTIRNLGDFTSAVKTVTAGQRVYLDGPYGAFTIGNPTDMHVLIAGGIGITPMMSMIRTLADRGDKRPLVLLYGGKDWESLTFREELNALKTRLDLKIVYVLSDAHPGWTGETGRIDADKFRRHLPPETSIFLRVRLHPGGHRKLCSPNTLARRPGMVDRCRLPWDRADCEARRRVRHQNQGGTGQAARCVLQCMPRDHMMSEFPHLPVKALEDLCHPVENDHHRPAEYAVHLARERQADDEHEPAELQDRVRPQAVECEPVRDRA